MGVLYLVKMYKGQRSNIKSCHLKYRTNGHEAIDLVNFRGSSVDLDTSQFLRFDHRPFFWYDCFLSRSKSPVIGRCFS